jgi:hypothetical protein
MSFGACLALVAVGLGVAGVLWVLIDRWLDEG